MTTVRRSRRVELALGHVAVAITVLVVLLLCAAPADAAREVRVGTYDDAPLISLDARGKPVGLYVDIVEQIAAQNGWRLTYVHGSWNDNIDWLQSGRIDLALDIAQTPQRAAQFGLNENPVVPKWSQVYVLTGSEITTVRDLDGQRIAVNKGDVTYAATEKLAQQWGVHPVFVVADTTSEQFALLKGGEVAAVATDNIAAVAYARRHGVVQSTILFAPFTTGFGTARGKNLDLLAAVDRYIEAEAGTPTSAYNKALEKWVDPAVTTRDHVPTLVLWTLAGAAGLAALLFGASALLRRQVQRKTRELAAENAARRESEAAVRRHAQQLRRTVEGAVLAMSRVVETRDPYTAGHERRVAELAVAIAAQTGVTAAELEGLRIAGLIHDIGKIAVPSEILSKPGKLSVVELELVRHHVQAGYDILQVIEFEQPVAQMALQHHERLDGSGYPQGLCGEEILPAARILAVADVVEAMSSHRPYRPALGIEPALAEIRENAGVRYDADVAAACASVFAAGFAFTD